MILFERQSMMARKSLAMLSSKYGKYLPSVILLIISTWILTENILENKVIDSNMLGKGITFDGAPEHHWV